MTSDELKVNHRILIVDDNASIHGDFREILCPDHATAPAVDAMEEVLFGPDKPAPAQTCFELDSAYQGQEALELVKEALATGRPYAMAFVDVRMPPGWDGIETIARVWEVDPEIQIVVCTAYADYSWEQMRARVGQPDGLLVLKKPFDNIEVRQLAHALVKKWFLNAQARLQLEDLTEANRSLALSEERFAKAFRENPLASGIQRLPALTFVDINQRLTEIAARPREEIIGRTPADLQLWDQPEKVAKWYEALERGELVRDHEASLRNAQGALREMRVSLSLVNLAGQPHALLLAQDVSEQALLERQLRQAQKMEAIGQLAAGVAHDFNNILTVVQGHAGLLQHRCAPNSPQAKSAVEIAGAAASAATLIRQLLMFSRKQVMQFRNLDLNELLRSALKMLQRLVGEHVLIEFRPEEGLPAIHADASMVEQIIMNLAVNARDALPNGGRVLLTTLSQSIDRPATPLDPDRRKGQYVCLTFRDDGIGMDAQILSRIFEPFFTTKPVGKGTGLGLSTVFGIVRQHQGWIEVESEPSRGTAFRIFFPASHQAAERLARTVDTELRPGKETVLVAEDEGALRQMVVEALQLQGYTVLEAASGVDALEVWERSSRPVDLLLTDLVMPGGIMGSDLAERLSIKSPRLKVIYTSGYSNGLAGKELPLSERGNFLAKPYSLGTLAKLVRECLDTPAEQSRSHSPLDTRKASAMVQLPVETR